LIASLSGSGRPSTDLTTGKRLIPSMRDEGEMTK
jgi:hypothetical protein